MASKTQASITLLGPATITLDGVNAGHVLSAQLKLPSSTASGMTGDYGNASVAEFHITENPMLEIELAQVDLPIYAKAIQAATLATSGVNEVLEGGKVSGYRLTPIEIIITPVASAISSSRGFTAWKCIPVGEPTISWNLEQQKLKATYKLLVDESKTDAEKFFRFGTTSIAADTSAPTISSVTPADNATGQSVAVAPVITFAEAIDEATIKTSNIFLVPATSTGVAVPIAASLSYNSSTFAVTLTPTSSLSASTEYDLMITTGIKDGSGNSFAGAKYSFTTA